MLHPDRLFSSEPIKRGIARDLYSAIKDLPIVSPHGHTDPKWFAQNKAFDNPAELLIQADHYLLRMLYSQGISLESLGIGKNQENVEQDTQKIWALFSKYYYLFQGTPTQLWLDYVFSEVFSINEPLNEKSADTYYQHINSCLKTDAFKPRALFDQFKIETLATTESALDDLSHHKTIRESDWQGNVITAFRPDNVIDPEFEGFEQNLAELSSLTNENLLTFNSYLNSLRTRRAFFKEMGATSTDHGHLSSRTLDLTSPEKEKLYQTIRSGKFTCEEADCFRAQMLTEMAEMSINDGLVMQIHPGVHRNHNDFLFNNFGRDKGADIPIATEYVQNLKPLLNKFGNNPDFTLIIFTLDESTYARELAPLAGHYPALKTGPAWWFNDSPEGMRRYRQQVTETAGFYNTVGFNDDTRAFLSIPARHDLARRMDSVMLAELVSDHRLTETQAHTLAYDLTYTLAKKAYKI
ncbi:glucuronate isomerase [Pseudocolwellia sp. HL-MZ7]|uniref:glucuronate isomerase n=1 Tax=Pseudocolwellia sp. HL-MZ7 TaxID=3400627 RepID=UPI003CF6601F